MTDFKKAPTNNRIITCCKAPNELLKFEKEYNIIRIPLLEHCFEIPDLIGDIQ
jgi:hypothetical protein